MRGRFQRIRGPSAAPPLLLAAALAPARDLRAGAPRLAEADGDRLLAARDLLARAARSERPVFPLAHGSFDFLGGLRPVLARSATSCRHGSPRPAPEPCK